MPRKRKEEKDEIVLSSGEEEEEKEEEQPQPKKRQRTSQALDATSAFRSDSQVDEESCASSGILDWVIVKNFMCHEYLKFSFSPNINFVQGRNGSGKSAILAAVVVGLGGTGRTTNRGRSLKDLVKHGKQMATIEIGMKNSGNDAFEHDQYGDLIIVERKIQISGAGSYKLKSKSGKVISAKKEDLFKLLDHFNLQVDNPITILNQDNSRAFLATSDPNTLYTLFLKSTQLQQMKNDYIQLEKSLRSSQDIIANRKQCLPLVEKELEEQRRVYEFCMSLDDLKKKLNEYRRELAWIMVINAEKNVEKRKKALGPVDKKKEELQKKIDALNKKYEDQKKEHEKQQEYFNKLTNKVTETVSQSKKAKAEVAKARDKYRDCQSEASAIERKVRGIKKEISVLRNAIEKDNNDAKNAWEAKRSVWQEKVSRLQKEKAEVDQNMRTEDLHHQSLQATLENKTTDLTQLKMEYNAIRTRCQGMTTELKGLEGQQHNPFTVYGQWVPHLLRLVEDAYQQRRFSTKPVGPLGAFIKLQDNQWGHVAEMVIGNRITAFCVDNRKDEQVLREIMKKVNFDRQPPCVIVSRFRDQVHNVSRFEVQSDQYPSLWSVLKIDNPVVANTIIDQMQVECTLLIPSAPEAGHILKNAGTVPKNCKVAYTLNRDQYYPDPNYRVYSGRGKQAPRFLQVSVEQKVSDLKADLRSSQQELENQNHEIKALSVSIQQLQEEKHASTRKMNTFKNKLDQLRLQLADLQNQEEPPPPDVSQMEEAVHEQEEALATTQRTLDELKQQVNEKKELFIQLSSAHKELQEKETSLFQEAEAVAASVRESSGCSDDYLARRSDFEKKKTELVKERKELEAQWKEAVKVLDENQKGAEEKFHPRINSTRSEEEVNRLYKGLASRLKKEEATRGNLAEVTQRYLTTKKRYRAVQATIEYHGNLLNKLNESLENREERYRKFRRLISLMINSNFASHLSFRHLTGNLVFDFENQKLIIKAKKVEQDQPQHGLKALKATQGKGASKQNLSMMSGGERSFATVSLIIALWNTLESPIRILDEFDVFMDVVHRSQAMTMMIGAARPTTQYIYLTPLSIDSRRIGAEVTIFRMPDPERQDGESQERKRKKQAQLPSSSDAQ